MTHPHLPVDEIVARLRETPLFAGVDDAPLRDLVARGEIVDLAPGEVLIREGDEADALFVVLDGELEVTRHSGESRIPLAVVGPGSLQGEIAALEGGRRLASVSATREAEVLRIPVEALRELLATGPDVALSVVRTAVARLRAMESTLREREKLAALGTLSAGLAHELNNPAAAALRSVAALEEAVHAAESLPRPSPPPRPPATPRRREARWSAPTGSASSRPSRGAPRRRTPWWRPAGRRPPSVSSRPRSFRGWPRMHRSASCSESWRSR